MYEGFCKVHFNLYLKCLLPLIYIHICNSNISGTEMAPRSWGCPLVYGLATTFAHCQVRDTFGKSSAVLRVLRDALVDFGVLNDGTTPKVWDRD